MPVLYRVEQPVVHDDRPTPAVPLLLGVALIPGQDGNRPVLLAEIGMDAGTERPQHIRGVRWVDIVIEYIGHRTHVTYPVGAHQLPDPVYELGGAGFW